MTTIKSALEKAVREQGIPVLDAELILGHVLRVARERLHAHPEQALSDAETRDFASLVTQALNHTPIAYLIGHKFFYGFDFFVDARVHIPRPETEGIIEDIKKRYPPDFEGLIVDIGTGSGCLAITLGKLFPQAHILATDISEDALAVARANAQTLGAQNVTCVHGSLYAPLTEQADIIISNPPYGWEINWTTDQQVFKQPVESYLDQASDGTGILKLLIQELHAHLKPGGRSYFECDPRQTNVLCACAKKNGYAPAVLKDLSGHDRILTLTKPKNSA